MSRSAWIRVIEIALILPASLLLAPLASASASAMFLAIVKGALEGYSEPATVRIMLAFLAAPFSMASLWLAILLPPGNRLLPYPIRLARVP